MVVNFPPRHGMTEAAAKLTPTEFRNEYQCTPTEPEKEPEVRRPPPRRLGRSFLFAQVLAMSLYAGLPDPPDREPKK